jgi:threonyl-tRNA synthetase
LRVELDERSDRMNAKIRDAEKQKVPFMLVVGDREMENNQVDVRRRSGERWALCPWKTLSLSIEGCDREG